MRFTWRVSIALAALAFITLEPALHAEPTVVMRYDPHKPNRNSALIWLAYLISRTAFHEEHHLPIPTSGEIVPSFAEEVDARTTTVKAYRELKAKDSKIKDAYWETLSEVERRGFMAAYVWTCLHRKEWPSKVRPSGMAAFNDWKQHALPRHVAKTYGWLEGGKP